nr:MAG TPA: hypothetical protein [Caudoviricetes sp.]
MPLANVQSFYLSQPVKINKCTKVSILIISFENRGL